MNLAAELNKSLLCIGNLFSESRLLCNCLRLFLQIEADKVNSTVIAVWVYVVNATLAANIKKMSIDWP